MKLTPILVKQSLNKAYLKEKPLRASIELFKKNLLSYLDGINEQESEEHVKNLITKFLYDTYYNGKYQINTKGRIDLAIYEDKKPVVIFEAKRPKSTEMVSENNFNTRAMHELILYYLRERVDHGNIDIKYLIITNSLEWFIFEASVFDNLFYRSSSLMRDYTDWKEGRKARGDVVLFYEDIAKPFLSKLADEIVFTRFDLRDIEKYTRNDNPKDDVRLIDIYKVLSPAHLLKLPFANDSNSLDKGFYNELLHIIGLEEVKDGGKKLIGRKAKPDPGSLLENTIQMLLAEGRLHKLPRDGSDYGNNQDERLFNVALDLCITWINRILFLKLLEGQLLSYRRGDKSYAFLDFKTIPTYDELNKLFFQVLALRKKDRGKAVEEKFSKVPYLNSSLFDISPLEDDTLRINSLDDSIKLRISASTVLKKENGKRREGELPTLQYLFEFLDSYDFSAESHEEIQEENKTIINAAVLGLIFEKINGYKDGSFFTPGFITMYMCRETIRRAVVQKFNEAKGWKLETFDELHNKIEDKEEANRIINSLKICDPAVGSGHFLVSALNEIIAIKSELRILLDRQGHWLKEYAVEVVNDELIVSTGHNEFFAYQPGQKESQRLQEALFHEKETLIENCLFGVDINPNSVKICRLRLWIELLKSAYYTAESKYTELETLPNIDINIKQGNSLISRFSLDADLGKALKSIKYSVEQYRGFVNDYKNATDKELKRGFEQLINQIKGDFRTEIGKNDPKVQLRYRKSGELDKLLSQGLMFQPSEKEKKDREKQKEKLEAEITKLSREIEEIRNSAVYKGAFEWRFEFPEVMDEKGSFVGFDSVIGNPPYIRIQDLRQANETMVEHLNTNFVAANSGNYDLYVLFVELGLRLLKQTGDFCFIMPHKFMNAAYGARLRELIASKQALSRIIHFGAQQIFDDATTYTGLFFMSNRKSESVEFLLCDDLKQLESPDKIKFQHKNSGVFSQDGWTLLDSESEKLMEKLGQGGKSLEQLTERIFQGLKTSADKIYILEKLSETEDEYEVLCKQSESKYKLEKTLLFPLIKGGDSAPYQISYTNLLIVFPYMNGKLLSEDELRSKTPKTLKYLYDHKEFLANREDGKMNVTGWYGYVYPKALSVISQPKLFTPDIAPKPRFSFDREGQFMFTGGAAGGYGIIPKEGVSPKYLLAILNSPITAWFIAQTSTQMRGGWYSFEARYIKNIPFPAQPRNLQRIETVVDELLASRVKDDAAFEELHSHLNKLVFEEYDLSKDEIKVVERA